MGKKKKPQTVLAPWLLEPELSMARIARTLDQLEALALPNPAGQATVRTVRKARRVFDAIPADVRPHAALFADLFCAMMWGLDQESFDLKNTGAQSVLGGEMERLRHLKPEWDDILDRMPAGSTQGQMLKKLRAKLPGQKIYRSTLQTHLKRRTNSQ